MGLKEDYKIQSIPKKLANEIVVREHYLHRKPPCSFSFGLVDRSNGRVVGVVMYGTPASPTLRRGICGDDEKFNVIELVRLWIDDSVPKNGESFLISNTLKLIDKEIVVSFAEIQQGHIGTVYQASNWIYTGLSAKRKNWCIRGVDKHQQTIADKYSVKELREKFGDDFYSVERPRKHRYVFFNCNSLRKKKLLKKLNYKVEEYPKNVKKCSIGGC